MVCTFMSLVNNARIASLDWSTISLAVAVVVSFLSLLSGAPRSFCLSSVGLIPSLKVRSHRSLASFLDEYWTTHPELHEFPIYYASSLAKKCMSVYQTYLDAMNDKIRKQSAVSNPFKFKHIASLKVNQTKTVDRKDSNRCFSLRLRSDHR
jgi:hypothetical protein